MITLHDHKLIFLKPHKVAGTSFEIALAKYAGENCIITPIVPKDEEIRQSLGYRGAQNFAFSAPELAAQNKSKAATSAGRAMTIQVNPAKKGAKQRQSAKLAGNKGYDIVINKVRREKFYNHMSAQETKNKLGQKVWNSYSKVSIVRNPFDKAVSSYFFQHKGKADLPPFEKWLQTAYKLLPKNQLLYTINGKDIIDTYIRYNALQEDMLALEQKVPSLAGLWDTFQSINAKGQYRPKAASTQELFASAPKAKQMILDIHADEIERFNFDIP